MVADEVRNLAQRSAQAAKDTAALIESSSVSADAGGAKVDGVVEAMTAITRSSEAVKRLIDEVSVASQQQAQGFDQVTQAINQMEKVTQTTAATAEEGAAASEELSAQAEQSLDVVTRMERLIGGGSRLTPATGGPVVSAGAPQVERPVAKKAKANVLKMPSSMGRKGAAPTAEELLPLDDTGTYSSF